MCAKEGVCACVCEQHTCADVLMYNHSLSYLQLKTLLESGKAVLIESSLA